MRDSNRPVLKYLERYAEDTARLGATLCDDFAHAVVIPSYAEGELLEQSLDTIPVDTAAPVLAVVNVNARRRSRKAVVQANDLSVARLRARYPLLTDLDDHTSLHEAPFGRLVLLRRTLPNSQGVGLARKLGVDFVLGVWRAGKLDSDWIYCTDADVRLPPDYFAPPPEDGAAMLLNFRHFPVESSLERPARIYDAWLRAYVLGLKLADSPYAYHTIGSTVAVNARAYAAVRGFPKRNAAEDFYLLNKLAKHGPVIRSPASPIQLAARLSERVPFGTGRAMQAAHSGGEDALPFFYHPDLFHYLRLVLQSAEQAIAGEGRYEDLLRMAARQADLPPGVVLLACQQLEFEVALDNAMSSAASIVRRRRAFHGWFDAFRTLRFIHTIRDNGLESDAWAEARPGLRSLLSRDDDWTEDDRAVLRQSLQEVAPHAKV